MGSPGSGHSEQLAEVRVVISYGGNWSANLGSSSSESYSGTGPTSYILSRGSDGVLSVGAVVQKSEGGFRMLIVSIETMDGEVLTSDTTVGPYGIAPVAWYDP